MPGDKVDSARQPLSGPHDAPLVVCLCAAWCGVCRDYEAVFRSAAAQHDQRQFHWIDVEDESDWLGDLDVETFPTLIIADKSGRVLFGGPLAPQAAVLDRLLRQTMIVSDSRDVAPDDAAFQAVVARLRQI